MCGARPARRAARRGKALRAHLDAGKSLNAEGYWWLLKSYDKKGKPPAEVMAVVDELLAALDTPAGKKLETHKSGGALLEELAEWLIQAKRWRESFALHERAFVRGRKDLSYRMHETMFKVAVQTSPSNKTTG